MNLSTRGFTLIELSVVLVVIGLIVGGVLAGRHLIRSSELASIVTDENRYVTAARSFQQKYNALPGDMTNATSYWGTDPNSCPNLGPWNTTPKTLTCNGNGDGKIENDGTGEGIAPNQYENFYAWQHLVDAGFIDGAFTGTPGPISWTDNEPGINVPATKLSPGGFEWAVYNASSRYNPTTTFVNAVFYKQYLLLGAPGGSDLVNAFLTPADALTLDAKIDDGNPGAGLVTSSNGPWQAPCAINNTPTQPSTASYNTAVSVAACTLLFEVDW